jgi:hypothetical protein
VTLFLKCLIEAVRPGMSNAFDTWALVSHCKVRHGDAE